MKLLILVFSFIIIFPINSDARTAKKVLINTQFRNKNWFPLTKKEMKSAAVDTALEELTRSNLIEVVSKNSEGSINLVIALVEGAATGKITIEFKAKGLSSIVTTASISLDNLKKVNIYNALEKIGRKAGKKMRIQLLEVIPIDEVDKKLNQLIGKDWDNFETEKLFNKAQELKREHQFAEAKRLFLIITKRTDKGSQQWKRLSDDELIFRLPLFQANYIVVEATTKRKQVPLEKVQKLYNQMLKDNRTDELRITKIQEAIDQLSFMKSMLGKAYQAALRSYIGRIQMAMMMHFAQWNKGPKFEDLKKLDSHLFRSVDMSEYKISDKGRQYTFVIKSKKTGAKAKVSGHFADRSGSEVIFY